MIYLRNQISQGVNHDMFYNSYIIGWEITSAIYQLRIVFEIRKKKQYKKLFSRLNIEVEYMYLLSDLFLHKSYKDVLDYIISVGCSYCFEYIPLDKLGVPIPHV